MGQQCPLTDGVLPALEIKHRTKVWAPLPFACSFPAVSSFTQLSLQEPKSVLSRFNESSLDAGLILTADQQPNQQRERPWQRGRKWIAHDK